MAFPSTTNLVAWWKLDEPLGSRADSFGTNHLTDINTVGSNTGKIGPCGQFVAASGERLSIADNAAFSMGGTALTISAWAYWDTNTGNFKSVVSKHDGASVAGSEYMLYSDPGNLRFIVYGGGTSNTVTWGAISTGTWYFIVAWYDPVAAKINIQVNNGTVISSGTLGFTPNDATAAFNVSGISNGNDPMNGRIDEVGIWRRVLTAGERTDLYNGGAGVTYSAQSQAPRSMHQRRLVAV